MKKLLGAGQGRRLAHSCNQSNESSTDDPRASLSDNTLLSGHETNIPPALQLRRSFGKSILHKCFLIALSFQVLGLWGCGGKPVVTVHPSRGEIRESFEEPARTRLEKTYQITMPVSGRIDRIDLEPGARVSVGQVLTKFDLLPFRKAVEKAQAAVKALKAQIAVNDYNSIEETALVEARSTIQAAQEALNAADQQVSAEKARADRAALTLKRMTNLKAGQAIPQSRLDDAELTADTTRLDLKREQFFRAAFNALFVAIKLGPPYIEKYLGRKTLEREVLVQKLAEARAGLAEAKHRLGLAILTSPIRGVVLEKYSQGEGYLPVGKPLLLLGNPDDLEVEADILTQEALRLHPGMRVSLLPAYRFKPIEGRVKRINPEGFTKRSSLGVEQQRVKVIVALEGSLKGLGVGYRLQARFFTGSKANALIVPRFSVMQERDGSYYVLKMVKGKPRKTRVTIGLRTDLELEITRGLTKNDLIVARPTVPEVGGS
jgi:HlyD family secretion protein